MTPRKLHYKLTNEDKKEILKLFYRTELRWNEDIIDNSTRAISEELGLHFGAINEFISKHLKSKQKQRDINRIDVNYETVF